MVFDPFTKSGPHPQVIAFTQDIDVSWRKPSSEDPQNLGHWNVNLSNFEDEYVCVYLSIYIYMCLYYMYIIIHINIINYILYIIHYNIYIYCIYIYCVYIYCIYIL